ncbi:MAG: sulfur carrier protein ThiS [Planctomycetales bacterium]|nr:sulfur carrier protein ThiS [Planctomycetales bacterium]
MEIQVKGEPLDVPADSTVAQLLQRLNKEPRYLAVERNFTLVPRTQHAACVLQPNDQIEIVTLVGGG